MPLVARGFAIQRASLTLPLCSLSLVRTFPRIINGYEMSGRFLAVVPMDGVVSARINGRAVGNAVIFLNGSASCTVYQPEARVVAIISMRANFVRFDRLATDSNFGLLKLPDGELAALQSLIYRTLQLAAQQPDALHLQDVRLAMQETILSALNRAANVGEMERGVDPRLCRYKDAVDRVHGLLNSPGSIDLNCEKLADEIGVSARD